MTPALTTPVTVDSLPFRLDFDDGIVCLGSCFADEIGKRLCDSGFNVEQNPCGTLYNPASMAAALHRIIDNRELTADDLVQHDGLWHSWHHNGSFSRPAPESTLEACNSRIHQAHTALQSARLLMLTFGTAYVFEHQGMVVANCHKLPPTYFTRRRLTVEEIVTQWQPLLQRLAAFNPRMEMLFTVSPIRHMADGAHGNQLSKSTLLLSVDRLANPVTPSGTPATHLPPTHYFPAYEIVLDELRDYRFFGPDMTHPTPLAADIVWDRLRQATMSPHTIQQAHNNAKLLRTSRHQPLHP